MMKNVLKKLLGLALVGTAAFTFSVTLHAEEALTEAPAVNVVVTEETPVEATTEEPKEETFTAVVTLTIEGEYNFVLNENVAVVFIEGPNEELIVTLLQEGKPLNESIQAIVATYGEEATYTVTVTSSDEELAATITKSLKEVIEQEVEIEISEQPEFITKRFAMANELGITPGKMHLLEKLAAVTGEEINYVEWSQKPVKEIMSEIKANRAVKDKVDSVAEDTQLQVEKAASQTETVKFKTEKSMSENSVSKSQSKSPSKSQSKGKK